MTGEAGTPDIQLYLEQATRNFRAFEQLRNTFPDWAATALFYAALQLVDAHAARAGEPRFGNHRERQRYVRSELSGVWRSYRRLEDVSRNARYEQTIPADDEFVYLLADFRVIVRYMAAVRIRFVYPASE